MGRGWVRGLAKCAVVDISGLDLDYEDVEALGGVEVLKVNRINNVLRRPEGGGGTQVRVKVMEARYCGVTDRQLRGWRWEGTRYFDLEGNTRITDDGVGYVVNETRGRMEGIKLADTAVSTIPELDGLKVRRSVGK